LLQLRPDLSHPRAWMLLGMGSLGVGTVEQGLVEAIDALLAADVSSLADAESIKVLERELSRLEAVVTKAVAAFDASGDWANDGAKGAAPWVATACRLPRAAARRQVRRGRVLRHLPEVAAAWERGQVCAAHLDLVAAARREGTEEALSRDEGILVRQAKSLRFEQFARAVAYWDQLADPDGTEEVAEARRARRDVYLEASFDGMFLGKMTLDPIAGAIVAGELGRIEQEFFEADWARAKAEYGEKASVADLWRTPAQRRADALVEMASIAARPPRGTPAGAALQRPGRLAHDERPDLRIGAGDRRDSRFVGPLAGPGRLREGRDGAQGPGRGQCDLEALLRGDSPGGRGARPLVRPPLLRPRRASLRGRPRGALGRRRTDHTGQRTPPL